MNGGRSDASVGLETAWEHSWPWPAWVALLLLAAVVALIAWLYRRERGGAGRGRRTTLAVLRISVLGLVLWMMYGWVQHRHRTDLPELIVMIDDSASMATVDQADLEGDAEDDSSRGRGESGGGRSRWERVRQWWERRDAQLLRELAARYRVRLQFVGRTTREAPGTPADWLATLESRKPNEPATRLGQCVIEALQSQRGRPTAAIVLVTDGVNTEGRSLAEASELARRRRIPLYCVGVGSSRPPRDVRLDDLVADDLGFVGDLMTFEARLSGAGYEGRRVRVRLVRTDSGAVLAEQSVEMPENAESAAVRLAFRPRAAGELTLALVAESLPGEATTENNRLVQRVTIREETLRVLLVQSAPSYEYRYLKTLLQRQRQQGGERERAVMLATVLQEADPEYAAGDETAASGFPASREALFGYDVVILGDADPRLLGAAALENLAAFVRERGGGLIVLAGPRFMPLAYRGTPLADLLPIEIDGASLPASDALLTESFVPRLTRLGRATAALQLEDTQERSEQRWRALPGWYWFVSAPRLRDGARVLLEHPTATGPTGQPLPLAALQFVGAGKAALQLSDESWRWARSDDGETAYARYWMQWLRWMSRARLQGGERGVQVTTDRERYLSSDSVKVRVRFLDERLAPAADDGATVVVQADEGGPQTATLRRESAERGEFTATLPPLAEGMYRVWLAAPETTGDPPAARFVVTAPAGEQTRLTLDAETLRQASSLTQGRYYALADADRLENDLPRGRQVRIEPLPSAPLWNRWPVAALVITLLTAEWLLRKTSGML
ncbi:MAG: hypothetical protein U0939_18000 [Pirellulales bacterium]